MPDATFLPTGFRAPAEVRGEGMGAVHAQASAPVLIFACGNSSRSDDALGPRLLELLQEWLEGEGLAARFTLLGDFQLQIEHVLDLAERELALFIDAGIGTPAPFSFQPVQPDVSPGPGSHALSPARVLAVSARVGLPPPPAFVLCVRGEHFELGEGLSEAALESEAQAFALLRDLCREASPAAWHALAGELARKIPLS